MISPADALRDRLLDALIEIAPQEGWTSRAVRQAANTAGLSAGEVELAAPGGPRDLIDAFADRADRTMEAALAGADLAAMKIRERVTFAVRARIEAKADHLHATRRAVAHLALTGHSASAWRIAWRAADRIWRALGDTSTDENYYSKRTILAGVLTSTMAVWLTDESADRARTWSFLESRIENVMQFERFKARLKPAAFVGWRAIGVLATMRYRQAPA